ncbi:unnamed protein product, partial [marine sediment metagenome]
MADGAQLRLVLPQQRAVAAAVGQVAPGADHFLTLGHREGGGKSGCPRQAGKCAARVQVVGLVAGVARCAQVKDLFLQVPSVVRSVGEVAIAAPLSHGKVARGKGAAAGIQCRVVMALEANLVPSLVKQAGHRRGVWLMAFHAGVFCNRRMNISEVIS